GVHLRLAWSDQKAIREIMGFLQSHGVATSRTVRIYKTYADDRMPLVTGTPSRLAPDMPGLGFKTAALIAEKLGLPKTAMIRARAGISYALLNAVDDGHCPATSCSSWPRTCWRSRPRSWRTRSPSNSATGWWWPTPSE